VSNLGKGGTCKKPHIIRVSGEEVKQQRKILSREEVLLGKSVGFGAKSRHIILNFWENTLIMSSCEYNDGKTAPKTTVSDY